MNRLLKPDRLDLDPNSPTAAKEWKHWFRTFDNFIIECGTEPAPDKFRTITNLISHNVFDYVEDCTDFDSVVVTLEGLYYYFINGLYSSLIRQRLLENKTLSLQTAYDQANSLDLAQTLDQCSFDRWRMVG